MAKGKEFSSIEIMVQGHKATVTDIRPTYGGSGEEKFVAVVDFGKDHPESIISMGVNIPAEHYTREAFIKEVKWAADEELKKVRQEKLKQDKANMETDQFVSFTREVARELGIGGP